MLNFSNFPSLVEDSEEVVSHVTPPPTSQDSSQKAPWVDQGDGLKVRPAGYIKTDNVNQEDVVDESKLTRGQKAALTRKRNKEKAQQTADTLKQGPVEVMTESFTPQQKDPNGLDAHQAGSKLDAGKLDVAFLMASCPLALLFATSILDYGRIKYTEDGWVEVNEGIHRYNSAGLRHMLTRFAGEMVDMESTLLHEAHELANKLFSLELRLRKIRETSGDSTIESMFKHALTK